MTRKQRRATIIGLAVTVLSIGVLLTLFALRDGVVFFYTPTEAKAKGIKPGTDIRLGGLVEKGSVKRDQGTKVAFTVTDTKASIPVVYDGILPDLFREEQGVVAIGKLTPDGTFMATSVLAKHDENYMPPEVAKALKEQGVFKGDSKGPVKK